MINYHKPHFFTEQQFQIIAPYLEKARMRLIRYPLIFELKKEEDPCVINSVWKSLLEPYFAPPANPEEEKIMILADMAASFLYGEEALSDWINDTFIPMSLLEIDEAYQVIMKDGEGWSGRKGRLEKRMEAVLEWFELYQYRLVYLKKNYLQDRLLYEDGGGQEKRNFRTRLLVKIIKDKTRKELTFRDVEARLTILKKPKRLFNAFSDEINHTE